MHVGEKASPATVPRCPGPSSNFITRLFCSFLSHFRSLPYVGENLFPSMYTTEVVWASLCVRVCLRVCLCICVCVCLYGCMCVHAPCLWTGHRAVTPSGPPQAKIACHNQPQPVSLQHYARGSIYRMPPQTPWGQGSETLSSLRGQHCWKDYRLTGQPSTTSERWLG